MSVPIKLTKSFVVSIAALSVLFAISACGSSNRFSTRNSTTANSSTPPVSTSEPVPTSAPSSSGLGLKCTKNIAAAKQAILDKSTPVLNHYVGNVWLNSDLGIAILEAEYIVEDPSCERQANAMGLVEAISYGKKIKSVGENRLDRSMQSASDLLKNSSK